MKAMLLAAGRGERMGKLTEQLPKPLLSAGKTTLIEHNLLQLRDAGIREVIINVHYLRDQIMNLLGDGKKYDLKIHYSIEENLLGTGGGIQKVLSHFNKESFLLLSSDIWTDYPFKKLMHQKISAAHLVLVKNPMFHPIGDYGLTKNGIVNFETPKLTYTSFALLHPDLFHSQKSGAYPLTQVLDNAISKKIVTGEYYEGVWFNIGTEQNLISLRHFANSV